jgi:hypothetical protein
MQSVRVANFRLWRRFATRSYFLHTLELIGVYEYRDGSEKLQWQDDMAHMGDAQWPEFSHPFTGVEALVLSETLVRLVAPALQERTRATKYFLRGPRPSGPVKEAIGKFIDVRELSACTVTIDFMK